MPNELAPVLRRCMNVIAAPQRPGKVVQGVLNAIVRQVFPVAYLRPVANTANGKAYSVVPAMGGDGEKSLPITRINYVGTPAFWYMLHCDLEQN